MIKKDEETRKNYMKTNGQDVALYSANNAAKKRLCEII